MDSQAGAHARPTSGAAGAKTAAEDADLAELATLWVPMARCGGASERQEQRVKVAAASVAVAAEVPSEGDQDDAADAVSLPRKQSRTPEEVAAFIQELKDKQGEKEERSGAAEAP